MRPRELDGVPVEMDGAEPGFEAARKGLGSAGGSDGRSHDAACDDVFFAAASSEAVRARTPEEELARPTEELLRLVRRAQTRLRQVEDLLEASLVKTSIHGPIHRLSDQAPAFLRRAYWPTRHAANGLSIMVRKLEELRIVGGES